ncbi:MAG: hypothetical protein ACOCWO_04385 [Candidatus Muiribacteriaceae bacterium]
MNKIHFLFLFLLVAGIFLFADSFDPVPKKDAVYDIVERLVDEKVIYIRPDSSYDINGENTPVDFAELLKPFLLKILNNPELLSDNHHVYDNLYALVTRFREELEFLGVNAEKLRQLFGTDREEQGEVVFDWKNDSEEPAMQTYSSDGEDYSQSIREKVRDTYVKRQKVLTPENGSDDESGEDRGAVFTSGSMDFRYYMNDYSGSSITDSFSGGVALINYNAESSLSGGMDWAVSIWTDALRFGDEGDGKAELDGILKFANITKSMGRKGYIVAGKQHFSDISENVYDKALLTGIKYSFGDYTAYMFDNSFDSADYPGMLYSTDSDIGGILGVRGRKAGVEFEFMNVSDIDVDSNGDYENSAIVLNISKKWSRDAFTSLKTGVTVFDYEALIPAIGLTDSQSMAFMIYYRKYLQNGRNIRVRYQTRQSGYAPLMHSYSFERGGQEDNPAFPFYGFNGNVNDFFTQYTINRGNNRFVFTYENMQQETGTSAGTASADLITLSMHRSLDEKKTMSISLMSGSKDDPTGLAVGDYHNMMGWNAGFGDGASQTIIKLGYTYNF